MATKRQPRKQTPQERPQAARHHAKQPPRKQFYLSGKRILPKGITGRERTADLIDQTFLAYNAARLREGCELFVEKMLAPDVTVAMSLAGALVPAGLGCSSVIPLMKAGFVDWIVTTGANMYHDMHFALNMPLHVGRPTLDDTDLRKNEVVRIYDILFSYETLLDTDAAIRRIMEKEEFQKEMGTAEFYHLLGRYAAELERHAGLKDASVLAAAWRCGVPVFTSSPGDSGYGMNMAAMALEGCRLRIDPNIDVNETSAVVLGAKSSGGKSAVMLMGGGSPKNFILQTEPQIQEVLGIQEEGHDYFFQVTDARPDTGGLSGATPSEAVSWGKIDPARLPDAVVCYTDTTIAMPLITQYALARHARRPLRRLYDRREELVAAMAGEYRRKRNRSR